MKHYETSIFSKSGVFCENQRFFEQWRRSGLKRGLTIELGADQSCFCAAVRRKPCHAQEAIMEIC